MIAVGILLFVYYHTYTTTLSCCKTVTSQPASYKTVCCANCCQGGWVGQSCRIGSDAPSCVIATRDHPELQNLLLVKLQPLTQICKQPRRCTHSLLIGHTVFRC
ncbi:hypothetical protein F5144DRAFT_234891 [Chaetomium tenue]|uniref:Uncharacterized protein n=1 Tax=Chaetomium tenue TaxID=1854479 RepID=A0ACB7P714_9PEZI|nr:hypothetical protein F5144DRAFT_234891 [Chaetomium globosum]